MSKVVVELTLAQALALGSLANCGYTELEDQPQAMARATLRAGDRAIDALYAAINKSQEPK